MSCIMSCIVKIDRVSSKLNFLFHLKSKSNLVFCCFILQSPVTDDHNYMMIKNVRADSRE